METFTLYLIRNKVNGRHYIGQTARAIEVRWGEHVRKSIKGNHPIQRAFRKHGTDNFELTVLTTVGSRAEADKLEAEYIQQYDCIVPKGYNVKSGGNATAVSAEARAKISATITGRKLSEEHRKRISEATRGEKNPFWGKHPSEESRRKMSASRMGNKNCVGRVLSEETKRKISESKKGHGASDETRRKLSKSLKGKAAWNKGKHYKHKKNRVVLAIQSVLGI